MKALSGLSFGLLVSTLVLACGGSTSGPGGTSTGGGTNGGSSGSGGASGAGSSNGASSGTTSTGASGTGGTGGSSGSSGTGGTGGSSGTASSGSSSGSAVCPVAVPTTGDTCASPGLMCSWNPTQACSVSGTCTGGYWQLVQACFNGGDGGTGVTVCPQTEPSPSDACSSEGLFCEWGSSPVASCDTLALCTNGTWQFETTGMQCSSGTNPACPATFADVPQGMTCTPSLLTCDYPEGRCACGRELVSTTLTWQCQDPAPGCPIPRPDLGTACTQEGQSCDYGSCSAIGGTVEQCTNGVWVEVNSVCPG